MQSAGGVYEGGTTGCCKPPWPGCRLSTVWRALATCGDACESRRAQERPVERALVAGVLPLTNRGFVSTLGPLRPSCHRSLFSQTRGGVVGCSRRARGCDSTEIKKTNDNTGRPAARMPRRLRGGRPPSGHSKHACRSFIVPFPCIRAHPACTFLFHIMPVLTLACAITACGTAARVQVS